jgi:NTE family protein
MEYSIGIVLSGGGVRGVAHVGALEALREHGIEPDCIAGNSAGAIVGALYAAGYSAQETLEFFKAKSPFRLSKIALRKGGIIDTKKSVADLLEYFPEDSFEALSKELFVTATDLENARLEIFTSGPLVSALLASSSMPMIFTPTEIDGRWFSDGGILNNFPVEPLKVLCDSIIGVYASPLRTTDHTDLKSLLAISYRAFEVGMYFGSRRKFHDCDVLLCPEALTRFGVFDTKAIDEIFEVAYKETIERMDSIKKTLDGK